MKDEIIKRLSEPSLMRVSVRDHNYVFHAPFAKVDKNHVEFTTLNYIDDDYHMPKGHAFDVSKATMDSTGDLILQTNRGMVIVIFGDYDEETSEAKNEYEVYLHNLNTTHAKERERVLFT